MKELTENWDAGVEILTDLSTSPYFNYDCRDLFSIDSAIEISKKLVELDPTCSASYSYVALLLKTAFQRVKVSLFDAVMNPEFVDYAAHYRILHENMTTLSNPFIERFTSSIQDRFKEATGDKFILNDELPIKERSHSFIDKDDIVILLKDALIATEMPITWIFGENGPVGKTESNLKLISDIMMFPSLHALEQHIRLHKFAYGLRFITVNSENIKHEAINLFVFTSPTHAFILGNFRWDRFNNAMVNNENHPFQYHHDGLDYASMHFPQLDHKDGLSVISDQGQIIGNINSCPDKTTIWLLLLTELIAIKLPSFIKSDCLSSLEHLQYSSVSNFPVISSLPFQVTYPTMEELIEKVGINASEYKSLLLSMIDGIELFGELLPSSDVYLDPVTMDRYDADSKPDKYSKIGSRIIKLRPFPNHHFGLKTDSDIEIEWVACQNLALIVNTKFEIYTDTCEKECNAWFDKMAKKKAKAVIEKSFNEYLTQPIQPVEHRLEMRQSFWTSIASDEQRFLGYSLNNAMAKKNYVLKMPCSSSSLYKLNNERELIGYFTGNLDPTKLVFAFNSADEIMRFFNCRRSSLPPFLQRWTRSFGPKMLTYPWASEKRGHGVWCWATLVIYQ